MKKAVLFITIAFTLAVCLQVPARAETVDTFFSWDTSYLSGTITDSYGIYNLSSAYLINYNNSYNITFPSFSSTPISFQYITIDLSGFRNQSGDLGRIDAQLRISFDSDADFSKVVSGGSFILGLWIQGYRESYDYSIDSVYFESSSGDRGSPLLNAEYIGYSSIGAVASRFYLDIGDNFLPLSNYTNMVFNCHWVGNPNSREINFLLSNNSYLEITDPDTGNIDYMRYQNEVMEQKAQDVLNEISVDAPDFDDVSSGLSSDFDIISTEQSWLFEPPYGNRFYGFLVSCGTVSVSIALLGYILYGKKG